MDTQERIFNTLWTLKKNGYSEATLKAKGERLRYLAKHVNLDDPEAVKEHIAKQTEHKLKFTSERTNPFLYVRTKNEIRWLSGVPLFQLGSVAITAP
jgi:hypothetical protein